jgi:peptidoglycan-associated lipoprotein
VVREEASEAAPLVFGNVNFDYDRFDLTPVARDILANHAVLLRSNPGVNLLIEGHCDERGTIEYNLALGERRAEAVKRYMTSLGVESSRFSTISYGKERPLETGHNETVWFKNRRAEFRIVNR